MIVYQHPGLRGLEIWNGIARYATLYQLRNDRAAYFAGLSDFLAELHAGTARTPAGNSLTAAAGFQHLLLAGGEAMEASAALAWPNRVAPGNAFAARAGVEAVWSELGWKNPLAIDLGQTQLKWFTREGNGSLSRDTERLPFGRVAVPADQGREGLREFVARVLPLAYDGVLLGLPNAIDANGCAESSTYPGLFGPLEPIFAPLFDGRPSAVVNDAVLTARGYPPPAGERTLVVTLGFGVGAALWH